MRVAESVLGLIPPFSFASDITISWFVCPCKSDGLCVFLAYSSFSAMGCSSWFRVGSCSTSSSSSFHSLGANFQPFGCFLVFFFLHCSFLVTGHVFCKCPVWWHIWHLNVVCSKSKIWVHHCLLCISWMQSGRPLLRSTFTKMRANVNILSSILCSSVFMCRSNIFPVVSSTWFC